jgi:hypothetical protein
VIMTHKSPFLTNKKVVDAAAPKKWYFFLDY